MLGRFLSLTVAVSLAWTPCLAAAQPADATESAGEAFERGLKFFEDADYVAAMVQFKRAYELDPNWMALYNIGQTARELKKYSEALTALERYLVEGGTQIDAERRVRVEGWVKELKDRVATVTLTTNVDGAELAVDDVVVGRTPLTKPVVMDAGRRKLTAAREGYAPLTRYVEVAGAESKTIELELVSLSAGPGPGPGPGPEKPGEIEHTPWPWVGLGVTAAFGVATGIVGGLAFSKKSDFEDVLATYPTTSQAIAEARSEARTFAITADVLGGVTIAVGVLTVVAFVVDYGRSPAKVEPTPTEAVSVEPILAPGYVGLSGRY